jgi:hypothetical protein
MHPNPGIRRHAFQHGFMTRNSAYDDIPPSSSHGFIVAPQMYERHRTLLAIQRPLSKRNWLRDR